MNHNGRNELNGSSASDVRESRPDNGLSRDEMNAAAARVLASESFRQAEKLAEFLEYVVQQAAKGNQAGLKETSIGVGLYGRQADYDPKVDGLVRTQARRVRERLERYYREEGSADSVIIEIPKGAYVPVFRRRELESLPSEDQASQRALRAPGTQSGRWVWVAATAVLIAVAAAIGVWRIGGPSPAPSARPVPRVAVFPFQSVTSDSENHLYGHAMADSIIAAISGIDQIAILTPKEPQEPDPASSEYDVSQAARMNADYVVTGSFDRRHEPATATVKLMKAASGEVIWSRLYNFQWSNLVKTEQEMSSALASKLSLHLGEKHSTLVARVAPASMEAYREFLLGHYAAVNARKDANLEAYYTAVTHLEKALALEPGYPDAHATLSGLYAFRLMPWSAEGPKFLAAAELHAKAALERAPRNSDALATMARCAIQRGDLHGAMRMATEAVEAEPGNADSLSALAEVYTAIGFHEAALEAYVRASRKTFVAMEPFVIGAVIAGGLGKLDVAEDLIRRHGAVDSESVLRLTLQGVMKGWRGDHAAAEVIQRQVRETLMGRDSPEQVKRIMYSFVDVNLALALAKQNKLMEAREVISRMPPPMPRRTPLEIELLSLIGQTDEAIRLIENSTYFRSYRFLVTDPELKPLYASPKFHRLLESTHPKWLEFTKAYGQAAVARPPVLPSPADFLRAQGIRLD